VWSASRPGRFTSGKERRYPSDRGLGGHQRRSGRRGEDLSVVQPAASRYTDYAIPALLDVNMKIINRNDWTTVSVRHPSNKMETLRHSAEIKVTV
jgi:hypothetical protein